MGVDKTIRGLGVFFPPRPLTFQVFLEYTWYGLVEFRAGVINNQDFRAGSFLVLATSGSLRFPKQKKHFMSRSGFPPYMLVK